MRRIVLAIGVLLSVACGESTAPGTKTISGDFQLESIDGRHLPQFLYSIIGDSIFATSLQVTLINNDSFTGPPRFEAVERDSSTHPFGKGDTSTVRYGGLYQVDGQGDVGRDSIELSAWDSGRIIDQDSFTQRSSVGVMLFRRVGTVRPLSP